MYGVRLACSEMKSAWRSTCRATPDGREPETRERKTGQFALWSLPCLFSLHSSLPCTTPQQPPHTWIHSLCNNYRLPPMAMAPIIRPSTTSPHNPHAAKPLRETSANRPPQQPAHHLQRDRLPRRRDVGKGGGVAAGVEVDHVHIERPDAAMEHQINIHARAISPRNPRSAYMRPGDFACAGVLVRSGLETSPHTTGSTL